MLQEEKESSQQLEQFQRYLIDEKKKYFGSSGCCSGNESNTLLDVGLDGRCRADLTNCLYDIFISLLLNYAKFHHFFSPYSNSHCEKRAC